MAIAVAGNASGSALATSKLIDVSGLGIQAGDTLVAFTAWFSNVGTDTVQNPEDSTAGSNTWSTPAQSTWSATFREAVGVSYCVVASAPTSVTVKINTRVEGLSGLVLRITGAHATTPYDTSSANTSTSTNPTHTAITTAEDNEMILCAGGHDGGGITVASDTANGWATDIEVDPSNTFADLFASYKNIAAASSGNAMAWQNSTSRDWGLVAIALKPSGITLSTAPAVDIFIGQS